MIQAGNSIGPYTLGRTLGRGAFGNIWLAELPSSPGPEKLVLKISLDEEYDNEGLRNEATHWRLAMG